MDVRFDEDKGIYRDCKFCGGKGCLACPGEAEKEYKKQFPNGPKPIMTANVNNPDEIRAVKDLLESFLKKC